MLKELNKNICEPWFDDIAPWERNAEEFIDHVDQSLTRSENNFHLKPSKCHLGYKEILFVGHLLSGEGTRMSDDRKEKFQRIASPTNKKELLSFLSTGQYFHYYVPK